MENKSNLKNIRSKGVLIYSESFCLLDVGDIKFLKDNKLIKKIPNFIYSVIDINEFFKLKEIENFIKNEDEMKLNILNSDFNLYKINNNTKVVNKNKSSYVDINNCKKFKYFFGS